MAILGQITSDTDLNKTHVSLDNVDNTSDANKPVSTAAQSAITAKTRYTTVAKTGSADFLTTGYANDSLAIIAAVDASVSAGLNYVLLLGNSSTTYTMGDSVVTLPSNFTLESQPGVTLAMRNNSSGNNPVAIRNSDTTNGNVNITLRNLVCDGNGANQIDGQSVGGTFLNFTGVQNLIYDNVNVKNSRRFNSFVGAVAGTSITGTITATKDSITVSGSGTTFTTDLVVGQRLRAVSGNMSSPIQSIESDTSLTLGSPWPHDTETGVTATKLNGVRFEIYNSVFGLTFEDDTFGGGGWDNTKVDNCTFENASGYGFGTTSMFGGNISNIYSHNNINGLGLERVNNSNFSNIVTEYNSSKGVNLINGSNNNKFINVNARFNADGFYDSNTSSTKGRNSKNMYVNCVSEFNTNNGYNICGVYRPSFVNCVARNNSTSSAGTYYGFVFQAANSYNTEYPHVRSCRGHDDQSSHTQTKDIYLTSGATNGRIDFSGFDVIFGLTPPNYSANLELLNNFGKKISIISGTTRATSNYETYIFCNQNTFDHLLPRLDSIVDGHKVKYLYNGAGTPTWTFARSTSDAFGTLEDYTIYPQDSKFWIEWMWDNTTKRWAISGTSGFTTAIASISPGDITEELTIAYATVL